MSIITNTQCECWLAFVPTPQIFQRFMHKLGLKNYSILHFQTLQNGFYLNFIFGNK